MTFTLGIFILSHGISFLLLLCYHVSLLCGFQVVPLYQTVQHYNMDIGRVFRPHQLSDVVIFAVLMVCVRLEKDVA